MVRVVRDWFVETVGLRSVQNPTIIWCRFNEFTRNFYNARKEDGFIDEDLNMMPVPVMPVPEYIDFIRDWVSKNQQSDR